MDYQYENLGDERFQEFCQALIIKEFPNTQALPVGQPDGGRDSITYFVGPTNKDFIVFQVKYVRNPRQIEDVHKWLVETIKGEVSKINKLIPRGAKKYYLITNVKGTSHLDNGAIDQLNKVLEESVPIPAMCWWRDDISRRLELNNDLKWSYTEIINGDDLLKSALFDHLSEHKERRGNVIRAYLADQYNLDDQVKFRQVDLRNRLLNLFTDVPIRIKKTHLLKKSVERKLIKFYSNKRTITNIEDYYPFWDDIRNFGAAEFLLSADVQNELERILVEGGPGQGKSTISQYVSQVHRIHLLNKKNDLLVLPDFLKNIPIRLPFKIDLRHIAAWIENKNPYPGKLSEESFSKIWQKSLESFMLGHILHHSQLDGFDKNDFISVCRLSPILFVFDGFDEIASLEIRGEVIDLINKGLDRIKENSKSIQVIITSRPAVFVDSISFSIENYPHFELTDITPDITKEYVQKWIKASGLDTREGAEIKRLVEEKLNMPHLKDLAKSPMQLAIFISLLRKKGESLPNKRTALYDNYIELFFDRESEKSTIIRDNRDLIIDIHEYLGWILHSEAEMYKNSGTIEIDALKTLLKNYLKKEGHKTDIADELFDVVKERVCALASRVQGTFEFEVQPLREYFCAKYLYKTSPYSPVGGEKPGTKPERFEAISKNYYWQNTVRFFAGCFDKGELPMLIHQLKELQNNALLKFTNYPRTLTSQILSDWVFTQYPVLLSDVVKLIIDGINIGIILNQDQERGYNNEPILLPRECGRNELINECFEQLKTFPLGDYANELIGIVKNNPYDTKEMWLDYAIQLDGKKLNRWLEYGYHMQIIHTIDGDFFIEKFLQDQSYIQYRLQLIANVGKIAIIDKNLPLKWKALDGLLDSTLTSINRQNKSHSFYFLSSCFRIMGLLSIIKNDDLNVQYFNINNRRNTYHLDELDTSAILNFEINDIVDESILSYKKEIEKYLNSDHAYWKSKIEPWDALVENGIKLWGKRWIFSIIAVIGSGIHSRDEKFDDFDDIDDESKSLCKRVRNARMKSGNSKYWDQQLSSNSNLELKLLIFITWATPKVITTCLKVLSDLVDNMPEKQFKKVIHAINKIGRISYFNNFQQMIIQNAVETQSPSNMVKYLLCFRMNEKNRMQFLYEFTDDKANTIYDVINIKFFYLIDKFISNPNDEVNLDLIKEIYGKLTKYIEKYDLYRYHHRENVNIPLPIAEKIMADCELLT